MAIEDLGKKAADLADKAKAAAENNSDKIQSALKSEQAEGISDRILDSVADAANKVTKGQHADKIEGVRNKLDGAIGNE